MYSGLPLHYSYAGPHWILAPSCGAAIESPEGSERAGKYYWQYHPTCIQHGVTTLRVIRNRERKPLKG